MTGKKRNSNNRKLTDYRQTSEPAAVVEPYRDLSPEMIRQVCQSFWGERAEFAYWVYDQAIELFDNEVNHPLIQWCKVMPYGKCIGMAQTGISIERPVIQVFESLWNRPYPFAMVGGVVIHEMLHFYVQRQWQKRGSIWHRTSHENEVWLEAIERLSPLIGITQRTTNSILHKRDMGKISTFPHSFWSGRQAEKINKQFQNMDWF